MKKLFVYFYFLLIFNSFLYAINVDINNSNLSILDKSAIFLDKTNSLKFETIKKQNFKANRDMQLDFGLVPNTALWIRFSLNNTSSQTLQAVIEYQSTEIEELILYDKEKETKKGLFHVPKKDKRIYPHFNIELKPYEKRIFYIKAHSKMRALSAKVMLWDKESSIKEDYALKLVLVLFFSSMFTLLIYNFMLWYFTKDRVYFLYTLYLLGILSFEANYYGLYGLYLFSPEMTTVLEKGIISILAMMAMFFILFVQEFLQLKEFKKLNFILKIYLYVIPITAILAYDNQVLDTNILLFYITAAPILIYSGIYALLHNRKEAKYYLIGWSPIIISIVLVVLQFLAIFDIKNIFPYLLEFSFLSEGFLFSVALAHRIEISKEQKELADKKLMKFQEEEQKRLKTLVLEKTADLNQSLAEKEILYQELNHRIKNNFMMILSLLELQMRRSKNAIVIDSLIITRNRIESISNLYQMLLINNESIGISTQEYLEGIYEKISINFNQDVTINYDIQHNLNINNLVHIGLIFNELITNSFKYAFDNNKGKIDIVLKRTKNKLSLLIQDNGKGFKEQRKNSLGLTIVKILTEGQLQGEVTINSTNGTSVFIQWQE